MSDVVGIGRRMAKGAAWTIAMRFAIRSLGLVSTIILARLLAPADFGLLAMATMIIAGLQVMSELSFNIVLITNQAADRDDYDTAWTLSIIRGVVMVALLVALAQPTAAFFDEPRLEAIFYWLAFGTLISAFQNIGIVDFQKHLDLRKDFSLEVLAKTFAVGVAISCALWWGNYWALVAGMLTNQSVRLVLSYLMHAYRPRLCLAKWREIWNFSKWLVINNIIMFFYYRSDTFIIGKLVNTQAVGIYSIAHEISNLATTELVMPIRRAMLPGFSKIEADKSALRHVFLDSFGLIVAVGIPVAAGIGLVADPLVRLFLGPKWLEAIPLIEVLAVYGILSVAAANCAPVILAMKRPKLIMMVWGGALTMMIPLLVWATMRHGAYGAAWAITATAAALLVGYLVIVAKLLTFSWSHYGRQSWRTLVAVSAMALSIRLVPDAEGLAPIVGSAASLMQLAAQVAVGAATYIAVHVMLWVLSGRPPSAEKLILQEVQTVSARLFSHWRHQRT